MTLHRPCITQLLPPPPHCLNSNNHQLQSGHSPAVQLICWSLDSEILKGTVKSNRDGQLTDTLSVQQAHILHQPQIKR